MGSGSDYMADLEVERTTPKGVARRGLRNYGLRGALDAARSGTQLPAILCTRPSIAAGTTTISAADINDLRSGVRSPRSRHRGAEFILNLLRHHNETLASDRP